MKVQSINPYTEDPIRDHKALGRPLVEEKVTNARKALAEWRESDILERRKMVKRIARRLLTKKKAYAQYITEEMGKPIKEAVAEVEKSSMLCSYYAKNVKKFLKDEPLKIGGKSYVRFEPIGVIGSIMPWNFPVWQALRFVIPSVIAGNVQLLKPSSVTPQSGGVIIQELFQRARFPDNVFQVTIGGASVGNYLVESKIDAISLTGSVQTGIEVATAAMKDLKKVVLELGGSDPFIVLDDADIDKAVAAGVSGRYRNCGQSCLSAKRFIVTKKVSKEFTDKYIETAKSLTLADPIKEDTDMGPMARNEQRDRIEEQINKSVGEGAKILLGGKRPDTKKKGYFFPPTVMTATNDMTICREETFGPVAPIITVENNEKAIEVANDTEFGLGASIWTKDIIKGEELTKKVRSGIVYVNDVVHSDPSMPFGGTKKSGFGRELSRYGLLEMLNIRTVVIN